MNKKSVNMSLANNWTDHYFLNNDCIDNSPIPISSLFPLSKKKSLNTKQFLAKKKKEKKIPPANIANSHQV